MELPMTTRSPSTTVFRTAFGFPLYLLVALSVLQLVTAVLVVREPGWETVLFRTLAVAFPLIVVLLMVTTRYQVLGGVLHLRMAFWCRHIPIETITSLSEYGIKKGRVYGLGTDLLAIEYEGGSVGVTPKDLEGFVEAVGVPLTRLGDGKAPSSDERSQSTTCRRSEG